MIALISLPSALKSANLLIIAWIAQTFLQLVLLPIIIVGQNVQAAAADKRSEQTYLDAEAVLQDAQQIQEHLIAQDAALMLLADKTRGNASRAAEYSEPFDAALARASRAHRPAASTELAARSACSGDRSPSPLQVGSLVGELAPRWRRHAKPSLGSVLLSDEADGAGSLSRAVLEQLAASSGR